MNAYQTASITKIFLTGIIILVSLNSCKNTGKKPQQPESNLAETFPGWSLLFDGQTLGGWEITNFGPQGPVYISGVSIILEMGDAITGITWRGEFPAMDYEVQLEAKKVTGNDFFCGMTFPVGESFCSLIIGGWSGTVVGLSSIDGLDASENETRSIHSFDHDTWYTIRLKVTEEKIEAWIDDEQVVDFETSGRQLSIRPEVGLSRPFGITSWRTTAALRNIIMRELPVHEGE